MNDDEWTKVISTILTGTFICSQEFAKQYNGNSGHIVNIGALTAIHGRKNGANYCSARAGVVNLTKCMALELAPRIKVNCVTPGWIETEELVERYQLHKDENYRKAVNTIPLERLGSPDDIFRMIYFIMNDSTYITGQNFFVDGGYLMH
jgi:NAD(P)-dependent dehydrogenase (short-subunit alcohol dehydrogenase family)